VFLPKRLNTLFRTDAAIKEFQDRVRGLRVLSVVGNSVNLEFVSRTREPEELTEEEEENELLQSDEDESLIRKSKNISGTYFFLKNFN